MSTDEERERRFARMAGDLGLSPELWEAARKTDEMYWHAIQRQQRINEEFQAAVARRVPEVLAIVERAYLRPALIEHGLNPDDYRLEWSE